jgi:hypothetical protein
MSRLKVYYPLNEITNNLNTTGSQWMLESLEEYKGLYHTYTTGEIYSGGKYDKNISKKLIPYKLQSPVEKTVGTYITLKPDLQTKYNSILPYIPIITSDAIKQGFITRYFLKKINSNTIIEIDKDQNADFISKKIDPNLYINTSIKWVITGPINEERTGEIVRESVSSQNKRAVLLANLTMHGIFNYLQNYIDLYSGDPIQGTSTLNNAPADINNLDN